MLERRAPGSLCLRQRRARGRAQGVMAAQGEDADLFERASQAWQQGRHDAAAGLLETLIANEPRHVAALNSLASIALQRGDAAKATGHLEQAAAAEPGAAPIWFNLFQAADLAGDAGRAMASLDQALAIDPYFVPAILLKAEFLARIGRSDGALAMFRAILAAEPDPARLPDPARRALD